MAFYEAERYTTQVASVARHSRHYSGAFGILKLLVPDILRAAPCATTPTPTPTQSPGDCDGNINLARHELQYHRRQRHMQPQPGTPASQAQCESSAPRRLLVLDADTLVLRDVAELWRHFARFSGAQCIGLVENLSDWYISKINTSSSSSSSGSSPAGTRWWPALVH